MRWVGLLALAGAVTISGAAWGQRQETHTAQPPLAKRTQPQEGQLLERRHYRNVDGRTVHAPAHTIHNAVPAGASAHCEDGT